MKRGKDVEEKLQKVRAGGDAKYHEKARERGKLFCRDRIARLLDEGSFVEDAALANSLAGDLPADGVVTGTGRINGRGVCVMANDSTVKAGSWGARTVEKILRIQKQAERLQVPLVYMVDSAGARITDQIQMFPGRRGAGLIFHNQVRMSGMLPQLCLLFGPSAAGGAYIPAFCDVVFMVEGNASMYLGSPRMAEMVIGQKTTLEEMGGAKMHCSVSGCGDLLAKSEPEAIEAARTYLSYLPQSCEGELPVVDPVPPAASCDDLEELIPEQENKLFDVRKVVERIVDADSFFQIKRLFAGEILTGLARIDGRPVGIVANQPKVKGGVLFVDSADKAARFIGLCDAFGLPLVFLADVPGFMIGKQVEREGIIRAGAKMIMAVSSATVPRISVILRKAYGAGLYAMSGPGFEPEATLALPSAMIAVMGP
ncbi:MAG: acyl-CoA carboxylase subunit beta, partial [Deltaproteobacteria bacterium]